ncbi:uncharacterized protein BDR25DRAFT_346912 [Lindgomyces ingoldianus]|uniref:Uncharacterized protein n=1 Tax=Lindgomyces ingoldianus TaxID=673940 RepID=A0ACB6QCM9_9PLEO|nr:uncharacterized protein BDR25DRAFT_346912 [Lindgomyces ingoldianus]KAF2464127.1 hypothetical protein BDR25DRAFT_346912 [Lindgomyces ingoldianus]
MSTSTRASLSALPDELLLEILSHLSHCGRHEHIRIFSTVYNLGLTNWRLRRLSNQLLYLRYSFYYGHPYLFLRIISTNPYLASHLKTITWDYFTENSDHYSYRHRGYISPSNELIQKLDEGTPYAQLLATELPTLPYEGDERLLNTLLIFALNLEHLEVSETYRWDDHLYWFNPIFTRSPHAFSRLTSAVIQGPMRLENITSLLILPSMRNLELTQVCYIRHEAEPFFEWEEDPNHSFTSHLERNGSNIEHLRLRDSHIMLDDLKPVMRAIRALKSFEYNSVCNDMSDIHLTGLDTWALIRDLEKHKDSLESLGLRCNDGIVPDQIIDLFDALKSSNLHTLDIGPLIFFNSDPRTYASAFSDALPLSLETLRFTFFDSTQIHYIDPNHHKSIELVLYSIATNPNTQHLAKLQRVELVGWHTWYGHFPENVEHIQRLFAKAGVLFSSTPAPIGETEDTQVDLICRGDVEPGWLSFVLHASDQGFTICPEERLEPRSSESTYGSHSQEPSASDLSDTREDIPEADTRTM